MRRIRPSRRSFAIRPFPLLSSAFILLQRLIEIEANASMSEQTKLVLPSIPSHIHFPPLPTIEDGELEFQVFTHASYHQTPRNAAPFNTDTTRPIAQHNEKLEHVGDALIGALYCCCDLVP